ncbi:MAG: hypothetical protein JXB32_24105 [Deltaproteobacteria bacterium]|nr:hypothetical protein [Deltaproteobacteria bacterium]
MSVSEPPPNDPPRTAPPADRAVPRADDENLRRLMRLTRVMLGLADDGDRDHRDPACAILYGTLRDMAYKLRRAAEDEYERHRRGERRD